MTKRMTGRRFQYPGRERKPRRDADMVFNDKKMAYEPRILEEHVLVEIVQRLNYAGVSVFRHKERIPRFEGDKNLSRKGLPDLNGYVRDDYRMPGHKGRAVYIECKRPGGVKRPAQILFIEEAQANGCVACFAERWDDVVVEFKKHGIELPK